jgi:hypothetical protein
MHKKHTAVLPSLIANFALQRVCQLLLKAPAYSLIACMTDSLP